MRFPALCKATYDRSSLTNLPSWTEIWEVKDVAKWKKVWPKLVADARLILEAGDMDLTSDRVWDVVEAREAKYESYETGMKKLSNPPPPIVDEEEGIIFNGIQDE